MMLVLLMGETNILRSGLGILLGGVAEYVYRLGIVDIGSTDHLSDHFLDLHGGKEYFLSFNIQARRIVADFFLDVFLLILHI